jgi:hypothetical protein
MSRFFMFFAVPAVLGLLCLGCGGEASKGGGEPEGSGPSAEGEKPAPPADEKVTLRVEGIT